MLLGGYCSTSKTCSGSIATSDRLDSGVLTDGAKWTLAHVVKHPHISPPIFHADPDGFSLRSSYRAYLTSSAGRFRATHVHSWFAVGLPLSATRNPDPVAIGIIPLVPARTPTESQSRWCHRHFFSSTARRVKQAHVSRRCRKQSLRPAVVVGCSRGFQFTAHLILRRVIILTA